MTMLDQLSDGRWLGLSDGPALVGTAFVAVHEAWIFVERLVTRGDHTDALRAVLRTCPLDAGVMACVPAVSPASRWLDRVGFDQADTDLHMATPSVRDHPEWVCIHPGMA